MASAGGVKPDLLYFCDETSQVDDEYMAVGGLAVPRSNLQLVLSEIARHRARCGYASEVKWSTAKRRRQSIHYAFADLLADLVARKKVALHVKFAPFKEYAHTDSGPRGRVDTVSKMYYHLLLYRPAAMWGKERAIFVYPDDGDCTSYLPSMREALCAAAYRQHSCLPNCIREIAPRDSKREPILQLLDVTLGALTAARNDRELGDFKSQLRDHVLSLWGNPDLSVDSKRSAKTFSIWNTVPGR